MHLDLRTDRNALTTALVALTVLAASFASPAAAKFYADNKVSPAPLP
jgi:hypothetical protein